MANSMVITVFISFDFVYIPVFIYFSCQYIFFMKVLKYFVKENEEKRLQRKIIEEKIAQGKILF